MSHEEIKRLVFAAERTFDALSDREVDARQNVGVKVNHVYPLVNGGLGVELIASYSGWKAFVNELLSYGLVVDTRRWEKFGGNVYIYSIYVERTEKSE